MDLETLNEPELQQISPETSAPPREADFLDVLIVLARRRKFILRFTAIVGVLTTIIVFLIPNKYTATSIVLPPKSSDSMGEALLSQFSGAGALASLAGAGLGLKSSGDMYVSFFRSRTVEDAIIRRFGLMGHYRKKTMVDTRKEFAEWSTVTLGTKDGLIRVTFTDHDPKFAAQLVNAWVAEFRKHTDELTTTEASQRRKFFQQQLLQANESLVKAEDAMKNTETSTGVLQLDSQARALIESAAVLRAQITAREVELQSMRAFMTEDNPQIMVVQQQLAALRAQLGKVAGEGGTVGSDIGVSQSSIPAAGMAYIDSLRDVRYYETVVELLAKQFELAKLDEAREGFVQISDYAVPTDKKSSPHRAVIVILSTLLGLLLACVWCIFANRWEEMKRDPEDALRIEALRAAFR